MSVGASTLLDRIELQAFGSFGAQEQCVARLDLMDLDRLAAAARHRLERLPGAAPPQRQLEYLAGRAAAAALLEAQGSACIEVESGPDRAPLWPPGFVGSITHSRHLVAVVAVPASPGRSIGIDVEPLLDPSSALDVETRCIHPAELRLSALSRQALLTVLFSAREAFFKCVYPLAQQRLDFLDVEVRSIDVERGRLEVCVPSAPARCLPTGFALAGSFSFALGHAFTAFSLRGPQAPTGT